MVIDLGLEAAKSIVVLKPLDGSGGTAQTAIQFVCIPRRCLQHPSLSVGSLFQKLSLYLATLKQICLSQSPGLKWFEITYWLRGYLNGTRISLEIKP